MLRGIACVLVAGLIVALSLAQAEATNEQPRVNADGSVDAPAFNVPFSAFAGPEAKAAFIARRDQPRLTAAGHTIAELRKLEAEKVDQPNIAKLKARYDVEMTEQTIGGISTQVFTPKAGIDPKNAHRVLINVHGGGFTVGARTGSQVESIPLAAIGRIKVISIDYRLAPENRFPAASEDVAAVYKELLKNYKPANMAIYGCSAGGVLTAQSIAWFEKANLPIPAAAGVFCASTDDPYPVKGGVVWGGDSAYVAPLLLSPPSTPADTPANPYIVGVDHDNPLYRPSASPAVLAKFPPTLLITGTRAREASSAARSAIDLAKAGVDARLFLWDGMEHGFFANPDLPESREAYQIMVNFFMEQMDKAIRHAH
jgi:acetyl esterase/lipase